MRKKKFFVPIDSFYNDVTPSQAALKNLGLYGNKIDVTRHSKKDASSLIHREDPKRKGLTVGLYSLAVLGCGWYLITFDLKNKIITNINDVYLILQVC